MNVFNRLFTVITLIFLIVIGTAALVSPSTMITFVQNSANLMRQTLFPSTDASMRLGLRLLMTVIFVLVTLSILWLELRRPAAKTIEVGRYTGGTTIRISTDAVESKIRDAIDALGGVIGTKVKATTRNKAIEVHMDVLATRDTDLVSKAEEAAAITRVIVQDQLGLKLHSKPQVTIKAGAGKAKVDRKPLFPGGMSKPKPADGVAPVAPAIPEAPAEIDPVVEDLPHVESIPTQSSDANG